MDQGEREQGTREQQARRLRGASPHRLGAFGRLETGNADTQERGFSLIELMIVVTIVMVAVALVAPSISASVQNNRASEAGISLVHLARKARSHAVSLGKSHLLRYTRASAPSGERGHVRVFRGTVSGCNNNDWDAIVALGACGDPGSGCIDALNMGEGRYVSASAEISLRPLALPALGDIDDIDLCYDANGVMSYRVGAALQGGRFASNNLIGGAFVFEVQRSQTGGGESVEVGVTRQVVLPLGGEARVRR